MSQNSVRELSTIGIRLPVFVVAAEDLVLSKLVWGKQSRSDLQLRDVCQMISTAPELDWKYMEKWAIVLGIKDLLRKANAIE